MVAHVLRRKGLAGAEAAGAAVRWLVAAGHLRQPAATLHAATSAASASASGSLQLTCLHGFASSSSRGGKDSGGGPPRSKIRAIPFIVTPQEALETFHEHHSASIFSKRPSGGEMCSCNRS